jgi:uncharacterized membrane protein
MVPRSAKDECTSAPFEEESIVSLNDTLVRHDAPLRHDVNREMYVHAPLGARVADRVTGFMGSWRFIAIQTAIVLVWIGGNVWLVFHFDPYPFILLNLAFSTQAAYAAPLILLAGNRAALRDRLTLEHTAEEADLEDAQNRQLLEADTQILEKITELEKRILEVEARILERLPTRE